VGGMGVVYLAEQTEPVRRQVALKILKLGMDTKQVVARFEAERQSLAVMEHPGIAKVYDAGATETGRPFFVMERVDGVPITEYCDTRRIGVRERVRIFVQVCRAVQHAHQKGVIHRDLKPSNVLVTEADGAPLCKIIDFGIARATEQSAEGRTRLTQLDQSIGTPAYMSPEQAIGSGLDIDTRTDVYSLGVLLYELLAGVLPFEPQAYHGWAFVSHHMTKEPPLPSVRFTGLQSGDRARIAELCGGTAEAVRRALGGDLDWIIMRALEKERERRYDTANGMAFDLERHLDNLPVLASPPSKAYAARKFVRRHRVGVAFSAALSVLLVTFAASMAVQADRVARARDLAVARQGQAEDLIDFMLGDLRDKLTPLGRLDVLGDVGAQAVAYFAALPEHMFTEDELRSRSRALYQIGEVRLGEGRSAEAITAFRESLRQAAALSARAPADPDRLFGLGQSHFWVGYAAWQNGDLDAAEPQFQGYLTIAEQLVAQEPENDAYRMELGYAHSNLGSLYEARGDLDAAARAFRLTLEVKQALVARNPDNVEWLGELAETHNTLAVVYRRMGEYRNALAEHDREMEIKRAILARDPTHAYWRYRYAVGHALASEVVISMGDVAGTISRLTAAAVTLDSLVAHDPTNAVWMRQGATVKRRLGYALAHAGRQAEARSRMAQAEHLLQTVIERDSAGFNWRATLVALHTAHARALLVLEDATTAGREIQRAQELVAEQPDSRSSQRDAIEADLVLGHVLDALGRPDSARVVFDAMVPRARALTEGIGGAEFVPLLAEALVGARRVSDAGPTLQLLARRGYGEPFLLSRARALGLVVD
jgi:eukaryotic-like serine/threonine-protein kinase